MNNLRLNNLQQHMLFWPICTLLALWIFSAVFNHSFMSIHWQQGHFNGGLIDIMNHAAPLILTSLGMTLVIAVRGLDISVGAVAAIAAAVAALMIGGDLSPNTAHHSLALAIVAALCVALLCGLWNGLLVTKAAMQPIIATLILMVAGRGVAQLLCDGQIITVYYTPYFFIGNGFILGLPFAVLLALLLAVLLYFLLTRTALDLFIRAIGSNPVAARVAGIRTTPVILCAYVFCGLMAGIAGLIISSNVKSADANHVGDLLELDAILAVTLGGSSLSGGRYTLTGSLIGALIIQTLTSMIYSLGVPPEVNLVIKAVLVFTVMLLQSGEFRNRIRQLFMRNAGSAA